MITYDGTPQLVTDRLILEKFELGDAQKVFDHWISDERVTDNRVSAAHKTVGETVERVANIVSNMRRKIFVIGQ
ncbi:hypothetical protein [Bacillus sp. LL01]|uniref:hypothetical protein n=1 Tax=Bacillus sp. LL01 TaxID=1665556 RepID=UPI000A7A5EEE|nr:hypothetical protein [Bacillus sp. LL01]